jgi:hypothetical protein
MRYHPDTTFALLGFSQPAARLLSSQALGSSSCCCKYIDARVTQVNVRRIPSNERIESGHVKVNTSNALTVNYGSCYLTHGI